MSDKKIQNKIILDSFVDAASSLMDKIQTMLAALNSDNSVTEFLKKNGK